MDDFAARLDALLAAFAKQPGADARRVPTQPPAVYAEWTAEADELIERCPGLARDAGYAAFLRRYFCAHAETPARGAVVHIYGLEDDLGADPIDAGRFYCLAYCELSLPDDDWRTVSFFLPADAAPAVRPGVYRGVYSPAVRDADEVERTWCCDDFLSLLPRLSGPPERWLD